MVPVCLAYGERGGHSPSAAGTIYSDDHGTTWQAGDIAVPNEGEFGNPNETMLTQLSDGRVMLVTRSVSKPNRKLVTFSADGARNWSTPVFHPELWEPICMASIVAYPSQPSTLLFSCPQSTAPDDSGKKAAPAGKGKRENLTIKLSHDDGRTWPVNRTLEPGASAYSDLAVLPDGSLVCFYEGRDQLVAARFSMEWLKSGETEANP